MRGDNIFNKNEVKNLNIHNEDAVFKYLVNNFPLGIIDLTPIQYQTYKGELSNELTELNKQYRVDTVLDFKDFIVNMEFFSSKLKNEDISKCLIYSVLLHKRERRPTITVIVCTGGKHQNITIPYFYSTYDNFNPIILDNSEINGWQQLNKIKQKIKNNEKLDQEDIVTLSIIATYGTDKPKEDLIIEGLKVLNESNLEIKDKIKIESVQFVLSDKFIKDKEVLKQLWGENMEIGVLEYVKEEGIEEGSIQKAIIIAKKLLADDYPIEKISKVTDLTTEQVLSLKNTK